MARRNLAAAAGLVVLLATAGCAPTTAGAAPTTAPTTAATSAPSATPGPVKSPQFDPDGYTCESILPPASLAVFHSKTGEGFTLQDDFVERSRNFGGDLIYFADFGGILCQWAYPSGTQPVDYAFSSITEEQASARLAGLLAGGYVTTPDDRGTLVVNSDPVNFPATYLFMDGHWFYASDIRVLDLIVDSLLARAE